MLLQLVAAILLDQLDAVLEVVQGLLLARELGLDLAQGDALGLEPGSIGPPRRGEILDPLVEGAAALVEHPRGRAQLQQLVAGVPQLEVAQLAAVFL